MILTDQKIIVLISGKGSNLKAIGDAGLKQNISAVISNNSNAPGLEYAKQNSITTHVICHKDFNNREDFDRELARLIDKYSPKLIVLAGFMRILGPWFIKHYLNKIINIHPSLLPLFVGTHAQTQALKAQVKASGATVHFVDSELDHGPIIAQGVVGISTENTIDGITARILQLEHCIYPFVIKKILAGHVAINTNGKVTTQIAEEDAILLGQFRQHVYY